VVTPLDLHIQITCFEIKYLNQILSRESWESEMITKDSKFDRTSKYIFESLAKVMQAGASRTPSAWNHLKRYELEVSPHGRGVEDEFRGETSSRGLVKAEGKEKFWA
jgi:hypothetical protein